MTNKNIMFIAILGFLLLGAVSFDPTDHSAYIEEELKKVNENLQEIIKTNEINNLEQNKILKDILRSLQPNAFDVNGNLINKDH